MDIPASGLPPLPPVLNPALEQAALTHSGMVVKPTDMSYERLEWIGDAYLYLMSTAFIFQTFPNLATGRSAQLRERLIKNETLSGYTVQYGIDERTRFPAEFDLQGRVGGSQASLKVKKKVLGDVFEAYVAAAILGDADGLSRVATWLKALWSTTISQEIHDECKAPPARSCQAEDGTKGSDQEVNPKVILKKMIGARGVKIVYNDVGEPTKQKSSGLPLFTVGVFLDGFGETNLQLGQGSALSKKEAGAKAAQNALENKKLIKKFEQKKQDLQAALAAQQQ
jgi:ribonuclease III